MSTYEYGDVPNLGKDSRIRAVKVQAGDYPIGQAVMRVGNNIDMVTPLEANQQPMGIVIQDYGTKEANDVIEILIGGTYNRAALKGVGGNAVTDGSLDQGLQNAGIYLQDFK